MSAGLGHHALTIAVQNLSYSLCFLRGVPTFTFSDAANHRLPLHVCPNCGDYLFRRQPVEEIPLGPGGLAYVVVGYDINGPNGKCRKPITLRLHLGWQRKSLAIRAAMLRSCGAVDITPFLGKPPVEGFLPKFKGANREN